MTETLPIDTNCLFCKIIAGQIPCHRVYEDEHVLAFLDIGPLSEGHTLVIPKGHATYLHQMPDASAAAIGRVLPRLASALLQATGATDYNLLQNNGSAAGQVVMHAHFHLIPRFETRPAGQRGLGLQWQPGPHDPAAATPLAETLRVAIAAM